MNCKLEKNFVYFKQQGESQVLKQWHQVWF